jgi:hypothetical protein
LVFLFTKWSEVLLLLQTAVKDSKSTPTVYEFAKLRNSNLTHGETTKSVIQQEHNSVKPQQNKTRQEHQSVNPQYDKDKVLRWIPMSLHPSDSNTSQSGRFFRIRLLRWGRVKVTLWLVLTFDWRSDVMQLTQGAWLTHTRKVTFQVILGTKVPLNRGYYQNGPGVSSTSQ